MNRVTHFEIYTDNPEAKNFEAGRTQLVGTELKQFVKKTQKGKS